MKRIKATEAAKGFGQLVDDAQLEPVTIEKNGRPVAVMYSYRSAQQMEALKLAELKRAIAEAEQAITEGRTRALTQKVADEIKAKGRKRLEETQHS